MAAAPQSEGVISWHHTPGEQPVGLPVVIGELARTAGKDETITLFIPGFGEEIDSAQEVVRVWEEEFGRPAVAAWISYCILPPTRDNLLKIAIDAPQMLADFIGEGRPVNLMMHSLGNLAVMGAAEAPELFAAICSDAPQPLSSNHWGKLPLLGSLEIMRPVAAAKRLGWDTRRQLSGHRGDERLGRLVDQGISEIRTLGAKAWSAASLAFSNRIADRAARAYVTLGADGRTILVVDGEHDKVVPPHEVQATLHRAEREAGLPKGHFEMVVLPGVPHLPWFLDAGVKLTPFDERLRQAERPRRPAKPRRAA